MKRSKFGGKKIILGEGLQVLLGDDQLSQCSNTGKETDPGWVRVKDAKNKLCQLAQNYYQQRYPGCKISFGAESAENVGFYCDKALGVYFRVQAKASGWPVDTLVIANVSNMCDGELGGVFLELFELLIIVQCEVGFINLGFEKPGMNLMPLVKRFGFEKIECSEECWTISMAALKERTERLS